jgi:hypothetical protein
MATRLARCGVAVALVGTVAAGALAAPAISASAKSSRHATGPTAPSGYRVSVFARATSAFSNPDSLVVSGSDVFVGIRRPRLPRRQGLPLRLQPPDPNTFPAVVSATLSGTSVLVTPVLMGNATATDLVSHTSVTLDLIDPDSLYVTPSGDLQLDNQAGSELVFIHDPGPGQTVTRLPIGNQMDDTVLPSSPSGRLLVSDTTGGAVYAISSRHFDTGRYLSAAPQDSGVSGHVGLVSPTTGANTPRVTGMAGPPGEAFIPTHD